MKDENVTAAFDLLLNELEKTLKNTRQAAATASESGRYDEAESCLQVARKLEGLISGIRGKQKDWEALSGARTSRRSGEHKPGARGQRTPQEAYRLPILRALVAMGGEGPMAVVLDQVFEEMKPVLTAFDLKPLPSDRRTPRWRNAAQWERLQMVRDGLLRDDSPRGIWAITEKGRSYWLAHNGPEVER